MFVQTALGSTSTGQLGVVLEVIINRYLRPSQSLWFSEAAAQAPVCAQPFVAKPPADLLAYTLNPEKPLSCSPESSACLLRTLPAGESAGN